MSATIRRFTGRFVFSGVRGAKPPSASPAASRTPSRLVKCFKTFKPKHVLPDLGTMKTSLEILNKVASALPGPVQAVTATGLEIVKTAEVCFIQAIAPSHDG